MCELMGLSLDRPAPAHFSIQEFGQRDAQNLDGWGLAWYPDRSASVIKEPVSWRASQHTGFLEKYHGLSSSTYIAHVRHKTVGGIPTHADTHPFQRELRGKEYVFAHNGTLNELQENFNLGRFTPLGVTDSEYAFCHLLAHLERRGRHLDTADDLQALHERLRLLNGQGELNCLLSDGQSLVAYHDMAAYKGLVWATLNIPHHQAGRFQDSEMQLVVEGSHSIRGFIVATHPMSDLDWRRFEPGELLLVEKGVVKYSTHHQM
jgi:predicted glutamine amidotransferase